MSEDVDTAQRGDLRLFSSVVRLASGAMLDWHETACRKWELIPCPP